MQVKNWSLVRISKFGYVRVHATTGKILVQASPLPTYIEIVRYKDLYEEKEVNFEKDLW